MKMATKLHEGKCGPCHSCEQESTKYTHLEKMDCIVAKLICDLYARKCVYGHACYKQALTNVNNPTFQPRRKPKQALPKAICSVDTCDETVYRNTNMACREQIENLVGQKLVPFAYSAITIGISEMVCGCCLGKEEDEQ